MFARLALARPPLSALTSTALSLRATKAHHDATLAKADGVLRDFAKMDVAFRVVVVKK